MLLILAKINSSLQMLFPKGKFRAILFGLVLLSSAISVSELLVAKFFTKIISTENKLTAQQMATYTAVFLLFFVVTRVGHFLQKIYRVNVFEGSIKSANLKSSQMQESWQWSLAFEVTSLLSLITQLIVVSIFFFTLNPLFSVVNLILMIIIFQFFGSLFKHQLSAQRGFLASRRAKEVVANSVRVGTRIRSGEVGALVSGFGMIILLTLLLFLSYQGELTTADTIIFFFGLKMQTSNLSTFSLGLMRFARALVNSE